MPFLCGNGAGSFTKNREIKRWGCSNRIKNGRSECDSHHVREDIMERTYAAALKQMSNNADEVIETVREGAMLAMEPENKERLLKVERDIVATQERVLALHKRKVAKQISDEEYDATVKRYATQIEELQAQQEEYRSAENQYTAVMAWLDAFKKSISGNGNESSVDALIMKALVEQIIVWDDRIEVRFKCGATVEQKYVE